MSIILVLLLGLSVSYGIDHGDSESGIHAAALRMRRRADPMDSLNVFTVPENCPDGQRLVNGVCRDIWRKRGRAVTAPMAAADEGQSRMRRDADPMDSLNVFTVPENCPDGQRLVNGVCRDIWRKRGRAVTAPMAAADEGQSRMRRDADPMDSLNVFTVPENCPDGQRLVNGVCRDIWRKRGRAVTAPMAAADEGQSRMRRESD
ncbi:uncharacterized protein LOC121739316 isoform X2 [Aricia agestis]|uniref:uncharacterized protein LOC121739316 isoform X2 n=1 Tax=Aricia agestis TaxID=91739 RepID=UPI001C208607|nr:uncharacterized protein LOC121739316 isoform X2 [Aricia agestis]